jgi:hypothetical protein
LHGALIFAGSDQAGFKLAVAMANTPSIIVIMSEDRGSKLFTPQQQFLIFHLRVTQGWDFRFLVYLVAGCHNMGHGRRRTASMCFEKMLVAHSVLIERSWGRLWPLAWLEEHKADLYRGEFQDTTTIADCSSTKTRAPKNHVEKRALFSAYYAMCCGKWAIAMSTVGLVSWNSKVYVGGTSDQRIIVDSNLFAFLYEGLSLLYDKGGGLLESIARRRGFGYACPYRMTEGDISHCEQRSSHVLSTRRSPVERMVLLVKGRRLMGPHIITRAEFGLADMYLTVCSFFTHFEGPLSFQKVYGETDIVQGLLTEDFTDKAGGGAAHNAADLIDAD